MIVEKWDIKVFEKKKQKSKKCFYELCTDHQLTDPETTSKSMYSMKIQTLQFYNFVHFLWVQIIL